MNPINKKVIEWMKDEGIDYTQSSLWDTVWQGIKYLAIAPDRLQIAKELFSEHKYLKAIDFAGEVWEQIKDKIPPEFVKLRERLKPLGIDLIPWIREDVKVYSNSGILLYAIQEGLPRVKMDDEGTLYTDCHYLNHEGYFDSFNKATLFSSDRVAKDIACELNYKGTKCCIVVLQVKSTKEIEAVGYWDGY